MPKFTQAHKDAMLSAEELKPHRLGIYYNDKLHC